MILNITFKNYELIVACISIILILIGILMPFIWNSHRARKKDFNVAMGQKADKELMVKSLELQDLKIQLQKDRLTHHEDKNQSEIKSIFYEVERIHTVMSTMQTHLMTKK